MDVELLKATIRQHERQALGWQLGDLAQERAQSLDYYLGKPLGNEQEGRSQVVTSDVADAVEGMLPSLVRVFTSGDDICVFEPVGPEDEEAAAQETDYVNFVVQQQNRFVPILLTWLRDGLISKVGYVKAIWEEDERTQDETYRGLSEDELAMLLQQDVEILGHDIGPDGIAIRIRTTQTKGQVKIYNCPPEEILVNADHNEVSLRNAMFVQHRPRKTIGEIRAMGYKIDDDIGDDDENQWGEEQSSRNRYGDEQQWFNEDGTNDPAARTVTFKETYIRVGGKGGMLELRRVCAVGDTILANDTCETVPLCAWTPLIMPHRHVGRSLAEQVEDIQKTKTAILRGGLDSIYLALNPRHVISDQVNLDDMLVSRPAGVVRLEPGARPGDGHVMPLISPDVSGTAFPMLQYWDGVREVRTGVMRMGAGLQTNDLNKLNSTATGASLMASSAQGRQELIARTFAETGLRDLLLLVHQLVRQNGMQQEVVRLRNKWVPVDPRGWRQRWDMTISVGLGTGNREQQMANISQILMAQREAIQIGVATPENIYNSLAKLVEAAGFKAPEQFFTNPAMQEPKPPAPDPKMLEAHAKLQLEQAKMQADQQKSVADMQIKQAESQQNMAIEQAKLELEAEKLKFQMQLEQFKAQAQAELEIMKLNMQANHQTKLKSMELNAANPESITEMSEDGEEQPSSALTGLVDAINSNFAALIQAQTELCHQRQAEGTGLERINIANNGDVGKHD